MLIQETENQPPPELPLYYRWIVEVFCGIGLTCKRYTSIITIHTPIRSAVEWRPLPMTLMRPCPALLKSTLLIRIFFFRPSLFLSGFSVSTLLSWRTTCCHFATPNGQPKLHFFLIWTISSQVRSMIVDAYFCPSVIPIILHSITHPVDQSYHSSCFVRCPVSAPNVITCPTHWLCWFLFRQRDSILSLFVSVCRSHIGHSYFFVLVEISTDSYIVVPAFRFLCQRGGIQHVYLSLL